MLPEDDYSEPPPPPRVSHSTLRLLVLYDRPPRLIWVIDDEDRWFLCCFCIFCDACMQFPGAPHRCPASDDITSEIVTERTAINQRATSVDELFSCIDSNEH